MSFRQGLCYFLDARFLNCRSTVALALPPTRLQIPQPLHSPIMILQAGMLTRALDTRVAEAAQLRKALEVAKREAARMHADMDELRQVGPLVHTCCGPLSC